MNDTTPPDALLLMGRQCPYCPTVLKHLQTLQEEGSIGELETVVIEDNPERARQLGVRSVPWLRLGPFELPGLRSEQELRDWASQAGTGPGMEHYLDELLSSGSIDRGLELVRDNPAAVQALLALFANTDIQLNTRIGISAIVEDLAGSPELAAALDSLATLLGHEDAGIRADACHFLALTGQQAASRLIVPLLDDSDGQVREIAAESLALLDGSRDDSV